ncbi:MAG TPA: hypothetical protein VFM18_22360 [Methanosarcina sp.]|nr:hypothetical protein [Methanosarcina sp.]
MKKLSWSLLILGVIGFCGSLIYLAMENYQKDQKIEDQQKEIERLNDLNVFITKKHNQLNHKVNELEVNNELLKQANGFLIEHSTPCSVTKAVKHTPLPPLKRV